MSWDEHLSRSLLDRETFSGDSFLFEGLHGLFYAPLQPGLIELGLVDEGDLVFFVPVLFLVKPGDPFKQC